MLAMFSSPTRSNPSLTERSLSKILGKRVGFIGDNIACRLTVTM